MKVIFGTKPINFKKQTFVMLVVTGSRLTLGNVFETQLTVNKNMIFDFSDDSIPLEEID